MKQQEMQYAGCGEGEGPLHGPMDMEPRVPMLHPVEDMVQRPLKVCDAK